MYLGPVRAEQNTPYVAEGAEMCVLTSCFLPLTGGWEGIYFSVGVELLMSVLAGDISSILCKSTMAL